MMTRSNTLWWTAFLLVSAGMAALSSPAAADKLLMTDGNTFEGKIVKEGNGDVVLEVPYGTMTFRKEHIKSTVRAKYTPPAPPTPSADGTAAEESRNELDRALAIELPLLNHARDAERAGNLTGAIRLMQHMREIAVAADPTRVSVIDAKIRDLERKARVAIDIRIENVFIVDPVRESKRDGVIGQDNAETKPQAEADARREIEAALAPMFASALETGGFIVVDKSTAESGPVRKLTVAYSETGGIPMYAEETGNPFGYKLDVQVRLDLTEVSGGSGWSTVIEAETPAFVRPGGTRAATLEILRQKVKALHIGEP